MSKKKASVKNAKGTLYMTDILNEYGDGYIQKLQESIDGSRSVFLIYHNKNKYVLKTITYGLSDTEDIEQTRKEYFLSEKMMGLTQNIAKPLNKMELINSELGEIYIEMLYEYGGESLLTLAGKLDAQEILDICLKTLEPLSIMQENLVFHSDIKPANIIYQNGVIKMIDFGTSNDFNSRTKLFKFTATLSNKVTGYTPAYCPPEILRESKNYILNKMDVYCWGMTIYQLITNRTCTELEAEAQNFKLPGKDYRGFIDLVKKIKLTGDAKGEVTEWIIQVLLTVLDEDPAKRPTFIQLRKKFEDRDKLENIAGYKELVMQLQKENESLKLELKQKDIELNKKRFEIKKELLNNLEVVIKDVRIGLEEFPNSFKKINELLIEYIRPILVKIKQVQSYNTKYLNKVLNTVSELRISIKEVKKVCTFDQSLLSKFRRAFNSKSKIKIIQEELQKRENVIMTKCCEVKMAKELIKSEIINLNRIDIINNLSPVCSQCYKPLSASTLTQIISPIEFHTRCLQICCYCGSKEPTQQSNCAYHLTCNKCKDSKGSECKICNVFRFKYLGAKCCNCEVVYDLPLTHSLVCGHSICNNCPKGVCNLCTEECSSLPVILNIHLDVSM